MLDAHAKILLDKLLDSCLSWRAKRIESRKCPSRFAASTGLILSMFGLGYGISTHSDWGRAQTGRRLAPAPRPRLCPGPYPAAFHYPTTPSSTIPCNLFICFPLYGVEASGLSTNMKAHTMHFTGVNGEAVSVCSLTSCSNQESILRSFGCRASAREPRPIAGGRVEGTTGSYP